jgi:predicted DNA-binding transcriptional regulator YafY
VSWQGRGELIVRQWRLLVLLRRGPQSIAQIARALGVCHRTVYRDLDALAAVPFPIERRINGARREQTALLVMPEWPRNQTTPTRELRA